MNNWNLSLTTPTSAAIMTLAQAKEHLRVDHDDEDDYIQTLIPVAASMVEAHTLRAMITQAWTISAAKWDGSDIYLPRSPLNKVTSIKYYTSAGVDTTFAASNYYTDVDQQPGVIALKDSASIPTDIESDNRPNNWRILFDAGYGADASAVPAAMIHAAKIALHGLFEQREAVNVGNIVNRLPYSFEYILHPYRLRICA